MNKSENGEEDGGERIGEEREDAVRDLGKEATRTAVREKGVASIRGRIPGSGVIAATRGDRGQLQ